MINRDELTRALNLELKPELISDYCPNGLQVEGTPNIKKLITGVSASAALIDRAIEEKADAILVHHGFFWKNESPTITGIKKNRIAKLIDHDINLYGYHLPLDVHPTMGNNIQLAKLLGFEQMDSHKAGGIDNLIWTGSLQTPMSVNELSAHIEQKLERKPLVIPAKDDAINKIAWCTGGAQSYLKDAIELCVDAYITGEISESSTHSAIESGVSFISAGHHATERYGVQAVGQWLETTFGVSHLFIDIANPV